MVVWRICKAKYADRSFSGEGGLRAAARWHHRGYRIVYTAQSLSLAVIETWVHVWIAKPLFSYVAVSAEVPDDLPVHWIEEASLPSDWKENEGHSVLQDLGTAWLRSLETAIARVPAATTAGEFNYLLNPMHPDFARIRLGDVQPFNFDPRMWK